MLLPLVLAIVSLLLAPVPASATPAYNTMSDAGNIISVLLLVVAGILTALGLLGRYARQKREWASANTVAPSS
jgi:hypothetical protein